jgi:hypothetical protein
LRVGPRIQPVPARRFQIFGQRAEAEASVTAKAGKSPRRLGVATVVIRDSHPFQMTTATRSR